MADEVLDRLRALLHDDPIPEVRREAARAVSTTADPPDAAVDLLVGAVQDANLGVRRAAVLALGRLHDDRAREALIDVLTTHPELWEEASAALAAIGTPQLVPRLLPLLDDENTHVRCGAIRAIAALSRRDARSLEPLFVYEDEEGHRHPLF